MLFSEPKIPQCCALNCVDDPNASFSALQRAENSSIYVRVRRRLNNNSFSALQRAENSSIPASSAASIRFERFQCSSASRKFLNHADRRRMPDDSPVSVLFSEPKIPQSRPSAERRIERAFQCSSASRKFLNQRQPYSRSPQTRFQCSSASRKFLNMNRYSVKIEPRQFQCSSASRKFLNPRARHSGYAAVRRFSALQRAENSSIVLCTV